MAPSRRFLQPINIANIELDPISASAGDIYYNSASSTLRYFDGTDWKNIGEGGGAGVTVSETAPSNPVEGQGWFKSSTSELYFWDGSFWVEATSTVFVDLSEDPSPQLSANLDANGYGIEELGYLLFDTDISASSIGASAGVMFWNNEEGTVDIGMNNEVFQSVGMEFYMPPTKNNSGEEITNGSFVMATGVQGDRITIAKAVTDGSVAPQYMIGIATETIPDGSEDGLVTTHGIVRNINTSLWPVGTVLYPNSASAGALSASANSAPGIKTPIAIVLRQHPTTGRIYVRMDIGYKYGEINSDVEITNLLDGDVLVYRNNKWVNEEQTGTGGGGALQTDVALSNSWWLGV